RNWDYRYTWLRDSAFVLYALDQLGYHVEVNGFFKFLKRVRRRATDRHVQIMFSVDGGHDLPERILPQLEGYHGARPVRVGNDAASQFQLDVYGEVLATADIWRQRHDMTEGIWTVLHDLVDWTATHWREPDLSIWEPRQDARHFVFSKVMAWVALDRGARLAQELRMPGDRNRWRREADAVRADVLARGWDAERQTFVQSYDAPDLDAAVLAIPKFGFLPANDPRVRSTLSAVRRELATVCEDLIYRYRGPDGLDGHEGAFVVCSFWVVENLAMTGNIEEAERLFRHLVKRANHVGLLAEEIDPATGAQLGNFPLGLSHAAVISAARTLERHRTPGPRD
ncbi:MAG TPA: glycoside hydrolase family 15 protein, partial [Gemmatimonadales bacterium]